MPAYIELTTWYACHAGTPYSPGQLCRSLVSTVDKAAVLSPLVVQPPSVRKVMADATPDRAATRSASVATPATPFGPVSLLTPHADLPHMRAVALFCGAESEDQLSGRRPVGLPPRTPVRQRGGDVDRAPQARGLSSPSPRHLPTPPASAASMSSFGVRGGCALSPLPHLVAVAMCARAPDSHTLDVAWAHLCTAMRLRTPPPPMVYTRARGARP